MSERRADVSKFYGPIAMASIGGTFLGALLLLLVRPSLITLIAVAGATAMGAAVWWATRPARLKTSTGNWVLLLCVFNLLLLWPELGLRLIDFRHEAGVEFGFPRRVDFTRFAPDPRLFWTYPRGQAGVNSMGFRGDEPAVPKPKGLFRVIFLGDSCTDLGKPNYPTRIERRLNARAGGQRVESVVMAVSGYSSHQGRVITETYGRRLEPDAVVVYFGWNDHWRALGQPDSLKRLPEAEGAAGKALAWIYGRWRLLQFGRRLMDGVLRTGEETPSDIVRVSRDEYRQNLEAIRRAFAADGTPVVFITAPTTWYRLGVAQWHIDGGFVPDAATAVQRHRSYNQVVREVAAREGALLLDLEHEFNTGGNDRLMIADGIHFNTDGIDFLTGRIAGFLQERLGVLR